MKWLYFQILIYKKILIIPEYYKLIIEISEENFYDLMNKKNKISKLSEINVSRNINTNKEKEKLKKKFHF